MRHATHSATTAHGVAPSSSFCLPFEPLAGFDVTSFARPGVDRGDRVNIGFADCTRGSVSLSRGEGGAVEGAAALRCARRWAAAVSVPTVTAMASVSTNSTMLTTRVARNCCAMVACPSEQAAEEKTEMGRAPVTAPPVWNTVVRNESVEPDSRAP